MGKTKIQPTNPTSTPNEAEAVLDPETTLTLARIQAEVTSAYVHNRLERVSPINPTVRRPTHVEAASRISPSGRAVRR
jgi:hypothetical protein